MRRSRSRLAKGNLLVGLLIMVAVSSIMLARAIPSWQTVMQRDREEELIFRGESYGEAIRFFQKKNGRLPVSLEELHKKPTNFIRKLYKDPMTKDEDGKWGGEWGIIYAGPNGQPILPGQSLPGQPADPGGTKPPGGTTPPPFGSTPPAGGTTPPATPSSGSSFGAAPGGGPIVGVYSKCEDESIKLYDGKDHYNQWFFLMKQEQPQKPGGPGGDPSKPPGGQTPPPPPK